MQYSGGLTNGCERKDSRDYTVRRLPGPAGGRLSEGDQTPEAPFGLFRDWQRTQTQSSVKAPRGWRQQIDVWFCEAGTNAERHTLRAVGSEYVGFARSSVARVRRIVFSLDNDLHRGRPLVQRLWCLLILIIGTRVWLSGDPYAPRANARCNRRLFDSGDSGEAER
jgi:hypothetical protein